jgi:hypothetical protein
VVVAGFHQAVAEAMAGLDASEDGSGGSCPLDVRSGGRADYNGRLGSKLRDTAPIRTS